MMVVRKSLPLLAILFLLAAAAQAASFTSFDVPGAKRTFASGINGGGDIVGTYVSENGAHGFRYRSGVFTTIDPPGAIAVHAVGINDSGQISGWFQTSDQHIHGFLYNGSNFTTLDVPSASGTVAEGINNEGVVVGYYQSGGNKGFKWSNGVFNTVDAPGAISTDLRGLDNLHHFVGVYEAPDHKTHSFIQNGEGVFRTLPIKGSVSAINDHKIAVGSASTGGLSHGFQYNVRTGKLLQIVFPDAEETNVGGINDSGEIVGSYSVAGSSKVHGFVRTP